MLAAGVTLTCDSWSMIIKHQLMAYVLQDPDHKVSLAII